MMKTKFFAIIFFACACAAMACKQSTAVDTAKVESPNDKLPLQLIAVQVDKGWGFEVYVDNKLFIKQHNIPAVSGFQSFKTEQDALKIGQLMIDKMKKGKKFPAISLEELKDAQIAMN